MVIHKGSRFSDVEAGTGIPVVCRHSLQSRNNFPWLRCQRTVHVRRPTHFKVMSGSTRFGRARYRQEITIYCERGLRMSSADRCCSALITVLRHGLRGLESRNPRRPNGKFTVTTEVPRPRCNQGNCLIRVSCHYPRRVSFLPRFSAHATVSVRTVSTRPRGILEESGDAVVMDKTLDSTNHIFQRLDSLWSTECPRRVPLGNQKVREDMFVLGHHPADQPHAAVWLQRQQTAHKTRHNHLFCCFPSCCLPQHIS